ncbi:YtzC family protein [Jeotgalibacillus proteolyticus]|uniref:DUF2524 domain-containing protein n=1 Tax=Jeotgalibacillus proteolyticus TaxID=2082395 RepID=A0A2S5GFX0_9BACL|nr:YtzC family protein [Jeotgalibacillus proteolyticus]PPA71858.1 DUF2524 domain-containing protein [Jeotgalibacillus proteolyticus]
MATRDSIEACLSQCEEVILFAKEEYKKASLQEHDNDDAFAQCQLDLEKASMDLEKILKSANHQQEDMLQRKRLQIQELQNQMILLRH